VGVDTCGEETERMQGFVGEIFNDHMEDKNKRDNINLLLKEKGVGV
jgi:phosphoserine phosphatase